MTTIAKNMADLVEDDHPNKDIQAMDAAQQEQAVGYREYHEALSLEVSDKEVIAHMGA